MATKTATQAMRRKAGAGRPAPEVGRMTPARAWRIAVPRAAEDTLAVPMSVLSVDEQRAVRDSLQDLVTEHALLALLEGPEDRFGLAIVSAPLVSGMIEASTTGRINPRPAPSRQPTRTDATICADVVDAMLDGFETNLVEMEDAPNLAGYRYAAPLADARALAMTLADGPYSVFRLNFDLGGGVRQGEFVAAFPIAPKGSAGRADVAAFQQALAENVMEASAELDAALHRLQMPLADVRDLRPGDLLRIPVATLAGVGLEAKGGALVAQARLGQQGGFRALRLTRVHGSVAGADEAADDFEDAAPVPAHGAAAAAGAFGLGGFAGNEDSSGFLALDELPDADGEEEAGLPDRGAFDDGGFADLPDLSEDGDGELADIPGLPSLSG